MPLPLAPFCLSADASLVDTRKGVVLDGIFTLRALLLTCLCLACGIARAEWAWVARVYDGDTFGLADGTHVRVADIDTPETHHPRIGAERGGQQATSRARALLDGQRVWLEGRALDRYGRRLARVRLRDGRWYSDIIRREGLDKLLQSTGRRSTHRRSVDIRACRARSDHDADDGDNSRHCRVPRLPPGASRRLSRPSGRT